MTLSSHNGFEEAPIARKDFVSTIVVDIGVALGQRPEAKKKLLVWIWPEEKAEKRKI